jgi:hypothetical protein
VVAKDQDHMENHLCNLDRVVDMEGALLNLEEIIFHHVKVQILQQERKITMYRVAILAVERAVMVLVLLIILKLMERLLAVVEGQPLVKLVVFGEMGVLII